MKADAYPVEAPYTADLPPAYFTLQDLLGFSVEETPTLEQLDVAQDRIQTLCEDPEFTEEVAEVLRYEWRFWARQDQLPPPGDWFVWMMMSGRGSGKTRAGVEWVLLRERQGFRKIGIIAETAAEYRDVIVEGPAGILACSPPWNRPLFEPSKRRLTWPSGATATLYSGDNPGQLRGPQHDSVYCDEIAKWRFPKDCLANMEKGLRVSDDPRAVYTTTPRAIPVILDLLSDAGVMITTASTFANKANLPKRYLERMVQRWGGTTRGRQELYAEVLSDVPGALWTNDLIERYRVGLNTAPPMVRIAVAVDPQAGKPADPDALDDIDRRGGSETGIICAGMGENGHAYILNDGSGDFLPSEWGKQAVSLYKIRRANRIIGEKNNGGAMVEGNILAVDPDVAYKEVWASRGKYTRAEPISTIYERGMVHHVGGFADLESEMTTWTNDPSEDSPNRLDALVWCLTFLFGLSQGEDYGPGEDDGFNPNRHIWVPPSLRGG